MLNPIDKINKSYFFIFYLVPGQFLYLVLFFWKKYSNVKPPPLGSALVVFGSNTPRRQAEGRWFCSIYSEQTIAEAFAVVESIQVCQNGQNVELKKFICGYLV